MWTREGTQHNSSSRCAPKLLLHPTMQYICASRPVTQFRVLDSLYSLWLYGGHLM
jgi:hypothetical protein